MKAELSIPELQQAFSGKVIGRDDAEYDRARTVHRGGIDRFGGDGGPLPQP